MDRRVRRAEKRADLRRTEPARFDDSRLRLFGVAILCLKLGLVPLVFDPAADVPFVVPRALLSHGLIYVLIGVLVGRLVLSPPSISVRSTVHIPAIAYLAASVLAAFFAVNSTLALFGTHDRMLGLASIADGIVTYFAAVTLVRTRRDVMAILLSIGAASILVMVYQAIQMSGRDPFPWASDGSVRPFSTLGQPTTLGQYLAMIAVLAFGVGALAPSLARAVRGLLLAYAAVSLIAAGLTGTRSVFLGVAGAAGVFVVLVWLKHPSRRARLLSLMSGAGAAAILAILLLATPLGARVFATVGIPAPNTGGTTTVALDESTATRLALYEIALGEIRDRPILGYGPDNFAAGVPTYRPARAPIEVRQSIATSPHSWIATVATSTGLVGLLAFLVIIVVAGAAVLRRPFDPIAMLGAIVAASYLGAGLTSINALETDTLFWLAVAAMTGTSLASTRAIPDPAVSARPPRRVRPASMSRRGAAWALVGVGVLLMATGLNALGASRLAKQSVSMRTPATSATAVSLALRATQSDPNRAEYWQQLALAYVAGGRYRDASGSFKSAARLAPYDIRFLNDDIQVQLFLANSGDAGALAEAAQLAERATKIDPNNPVGHSNRAVVSLARRDIPQALDSIRKTLALVPDPYDSLFATASQVYVTAAKSALAAGRVDDALAIAHEGIQALGTRSFSVGIRIEYIRALIAAGRTSDASMELDAVLRISPGNPDALGLRAQLQGK